MSFYWQQALQNQDTSQNSNQNQNQNQQQGQWDYINLGGPPNQNYQWNPTGQPQSQSQHQQNYSTYTQQQESNQNASNQQNNSWSQPQQQQYQQQAYQAQQAAPPVQQQQNQPPKRQQQQQVEHTPILTQHHVQQLQNQNYAPPTPSAPPIAQAPLPPPVQPVQPVQPIQQTQQAQRNQEALLFHQQQQQQLVQQEHTPPPPAQAELSQQAQRIQEALLHHKQQQQRFFQQEHTPSPLAQAETSQQAQQIRIQEALLHHQQQQQQLVQQEHTPPPPAQAELSQQAQQIQEALLHHKQQQQRFFQQEHTPSPPAQAEISQQAQRIQEALLHHRKQQQKFFQHQHEHSPAPTALVETPQQEPETPRQPEVVQQPPIPTAHVNPSKEPVQEVHVLPQAAPVPLVVPNPPKDEANQFKTPYLPGNPSEEQAKAVTASSSEDDWEKADMEVHVVQNEAKKQQAVAAQSAEKADDSRESSLGGSWSQNDQENSERNSVDQSTATNNWEQEIVEPVHQEVTSFSMTVTNTSAEQAEVSEIRQITPDVKSASAALNLSSPGEAQATSTPKDTKSEKRGSTSSQKTLVSEEPPANAKNNKLQTQKESEDKDEASGNNSDSTVASGQPPLERGNIRASYRHYKQQYSEILKRLNGHRIDKNRSEFRPSSKLANPLLAAAGFTGSPSINRSLRNDGRASVPLQQSQSFSEDLYSSGRGQRVSRLEGGRPSSRQAGYPVSNQSFNVHNDSRASNRHSQQAYQHGRYSTIGVPFRDNYGAPGYDPRRPQSHYVVDQQFSNGYDEEIQDEQESISESGDEEASGDSEDELRQYNMRNPNYAYSIPSQSRSHYKQQPQQHVSDGAELYYLGVVHIDLNTYHRILERQPPPAQYYELPPIEKAAFMFFAAVYKQQYKNVDAFHKRFNREFYKYVCAGDSNDEALYKICKSMQDQYVARMQEQKQNYEASNKNLFSDDNSVDGQSDINSVNDDLHSTNSFREPLHFSCPHAFMTFGVGGKTISVHPEQSISVVGVDDVKRFLKDVPTLRIFDSAQTFKGPLIPNQSAPHTVRLYISKQIEFIKRTEVAQENPYDNDVVESLLVWQLLETMVKQQGNITGPDIAELLAKVANQPVNIEAPKQISDITPALNQFTQFLLGGHVDEAVEGAIRNGLFADALVLTRRLYPNDEKKISEIEERFLQTRSVNNPVTTLVSVASGLAPPVLTNPPLDDHLSWRTHAAIILANLDQKDTAMNTIYHLGRALAKRDYHCAADFCFLVGCVLAGYDPFQPIAAAEGEEDVRRHISLVSSGLPDDEDAVRCQYGFSVTDLHATEIFDYALRLKPERGESPLSRSVEYQTARMKYAKLLASHGYTTDAYRYCVEIARSIWDHFYNFKMTDLLELCDLAESLHYMASADSAETLWIEQMRTMCLAHNNPSANVLPQNDENHSNVKSEDGSSYQNANQQHQDAEFSNYEADVNSSNHQETHSQQGHFEDFVQEVVAPPPPETPTVPSLMDFIPQPNQHVAEQPTRQPTPPPQIPSEPVNTTVDNDIWIHSQNQQNQQHQNSESSHVPPPQIPVPEPQQQQQQQPPVQTHQQHTQLEHPQQQQSQMPQQPLSDPNAGPPANVDEQKQNLGLASNGSRGWLGSIRDKVSKAIPAQNQMILPDDKQPTIKWDPTQNRYIGDGIVEESTAPPPPSVQPAQQAPIQSGGLRAARGASRYAKVGLGGSSTNAPSAPAGMAPPMPLPTTFGFMPAPVDDGDSVDPFSGQANPTIQQSAPLPSDE